eukprot:CAMPEP_0175284152 /NCGR_PEP_ID=MMETSP0093-20121207/52522_1 /TAXON_ID=311494 /ORGANISM="Alexandrium monilatum, Strain CCMP3105" /LENGTH=114 /DNA_ID=CAMNT_0016579421 /DNA_START=337 /DNA_END=681 /DNA_ORIENTATION=+
MLFRYVQVLRLQLHQFQIKFGESIVLPALKLEVERVLTFSEAHLQGVRGAAHLQNSGESVHVHPEGHWPVTPELCEGRLPKHHGDQGNMRGVHRLHLQAALIAVKIDILAQLLH